MSANTVFSAFRLNFIVLRFRFSVSLPAAVSPLVIPGHFSGYRVPFLTDVATPGAPSLLPLFNEVHHNFLIANYESSMCVDNDDGSAE